MAGFAPATPSMGPEPLD